VLLLAWRGVRYNSGRYIATVVAIVTGVAFFSATGFLGDGVVEALEGDIDRQYENVDVAVVPDETAEDGADGGSGISVENEFLEDLRLSGESYDALLAAEGVEGGAGILTGAVAFARDDETIFADGATGRLWIEDDELNPLDIDEGRAPEAAGELTVDRGIADDESLAVGDPVTLLTLAGPFEATVVGITTFGDGDAADQGGTVGLPEASAFDYLSSGVVEYEEVYLRGAGDQAALAESVEPLVPEGFRAQPGAEFLDDKRSEAGGFGRVLKTGLQGFSLLALLVGAFVIYNTFSVIVVQRLRELAVLAAVGCTPKQIKRSLRLEGLLIGVVGSVLGVLVGFGLAFVLIAAVGLLGIDLPGSGVAPSAPVIVQGLLLGTVITFLSVMVPARRAAKTEPIEALRDAAVETASVSRRRVIACAVLIAFGLLNILTGGTGVTIGLGVLLLFIGVVLAGPLIAIGGARLLAPIMAKLGLEGRLALDNAARNPQRTATTANALLIGVFLVTLVTVAGGSARNFAVSELQKLESADYSISSTGGTIDDELVDGLVGIDGVKQVVPFRTESVTIDGDAARLSNGDLVALSEVAALDVEDGSLDDLTEGTIAVSANEQFGHEVGEVVTVVDAAGDTADLEVVALIEDSIDSVFVGGLTDEATFDALVGDTAPTEAFIDVETGAQSDVEDAIDEQLALRPDISLIAGNAIGQLFGQVFDFLINAVNGLLLMSVLVALIGIVNTLSLSILERRRELGLLRIVGMVDRRVQRMVQLESVLISVLGAVTGLVLGAFVGWAIIFSIDRLAEAGVPFTFPALQLLLILVLGVVLGALAAFIPSRRSTRLDVLDAIAAT
jgi:putative ABC transport system permease protein